MALTEAQIRHIAALARLELSEAEIEHYTEQLSAILDHFQQLQTVETGNMNPAGGYFAAQMLLRSDEPRPALPHADLLCNAPAITEDQFQVPPIFE